MRFQHVKGGTGEVIRATAAIGTLMDAAIRPVRPTVFSPFCM